MKKIAYALAFLTAVSVQDASARDYVAPREQPRIDWVGWEAQKKARKFVCDEINLCLAYPFSDYSDDLSLRFSVRPPAYKELNEKDNVVYYELDRSKVSAFGFEVLKGGKPIATFSGRTTTSYWSVVEGVLKFSDGEEWNLFNDHSRTWAIQGASMIRGNDEVERKAESERRAQKAAAEKWRKRIAVGNESSEGMVLEVKGELVKVQISTCVQRDYQGSCMNYGNGEKWFRRSELSPR